MDLYVYYKVGAAAAGELASLVATLQSSLAASHGVTPTLRRRPGEQDGLQTWMEVYPDVPGGFSAALSHAVGASGMEALIAGQRHTETFVEIDACA